LLPQQVTYLPTTSELDTAKSELEKLGGRVYAAALDVRSDASVDDFFAGSIAELGKIDILVNAAGAGGYQPMMGHPDEFWHRMIDVNLNGPFRTIKRVFPGMMERGWGRIVSIASTASTEGEAGRAAYCAAKSGQLGLMRCVALEGATHGVTCNTVSPGHLLTTTTHEYARREAERGGNQRSIDEILADKRRATVQKRLIDPDEIAATVLFLCSEEARSFTMENLRHSGGMRY
jgi:NAD(P)-dependent dehydrogenase (short-subunit alcohol dehydrogenase family)